MIGLESIKQVVVKTVVSCTKSLEKDAKLLFKADKIISNGSIYEYTNNQIQIEETYSTQSQIGRPSLASKALNQDIEIVPSKKKRGRKPKQQQNQANESNNNEQASQVIHGTQYGIITRRRKATQSNDQ